MRHPVTDVALLAYIAKKKLGVVSYTEATKACKSSSSASRALHQLIQEGLLDPQPKLLGLRYVTQYVVTDKGKKVSNLALQLTQLREVAKASRDKAAETEGPSSGSSSTAEVEEKRTQIASAGQEQQSLEQTSVSVQTKKRKKSPAQKRATTINVSKKKS